MGRWVKNGKRKGIRDRNSRIKYLDDDFFGDGLLKEDVEKYKCSFIESPTDLEEHIIWLYDDIYLSDNNIYCYCEETINKIKEFVDYVNEEYGIPKRWRAEKGGIYWFIDTDFSGKVRDLWDQRSTDENVRYNLGNYFKTLEEAEKVKVELDKFWAKVRAGEIGND